MYRKLLKEALSLTWQNKYLWFFGLFASLLAGGGEYEILSRMAGGATREDLFPGLQRLIEAQFFSKQAIINIANNFSQNPVVIIVIFILFTLSIILICFTLWLSIVSQVALVNNSSQIIKKQRLLFRIRSGFQAGIEKFWPVFGLNISIKVAINLLIFLVTILALKSSFAYIYYVLFVLFIPIIISLAFIVKYATCYLIIKNENFKDSLLKGSKLFFANWIISMEMAFLLFLINFVFSFLVVFIINILTQPILLLSVMLFQKVSFAFFWVIVVLSLLLFFTLIMGFGAFLTSFQIVVWTNLFHKLISKSKDESKIERILSPINKPLINRVAYEKSNK